MPENCLFGHFQTKLPNGHQYDFPLTPVAQTVVPQHALEEKKDLTYVSEINQQKDTSQDTPMVPSKDISSRDTEVL